MNTVISTDGLILKEQKIKENDRLVTILTRDLGVIRAFDSGSLKISSKNLSATAFLSYSRLNIYKGRDTYRINSASPLKIFWDLRNDFTLLSLASYFCEVSLNLSPKEENAEDYLRLLLNCLHLLSSDNTQFNQQKIKSVFELKMAQYSGYMPDISSCTKCRAEISDCFFDTLGGVFYCNDCAKSIETKKLTKIKNSVLSSIRHILINPLEKSFAFNVNEDTINSLSAITEEFLLHQTAKSFDTLQFYKTYSL